MKFYNNMMLSEKITYDKNELIEKIIQGEMLYRIYMIVVPLWKCDNQLEIYHEALHSQSCYQNMDSLVIGIAVGYQEALQMVQSITEQVVEDTGTAEIKKYYLDKMELETV